MAKETKKPVVDPKEGQTETNENVADPIEQFENSTSLQVENEKMIEPATPATEPVRQTNVVKVDETEFEAPWKRISENVDVHDFEKYPTLNGIFCGKGKTLGEGKNAAKTWLIFDLENGLFVMVPQWGALEALGKKNIAITEVSISYHGKVYEEKDNPNSKVKYVKCSVLAREAAPSKRINTDDIPTFEKESEDEE